MPQSRLNLNKNSQSKFRKAFAKPRQQAKIQQSSPIRKKNSANHKVAHSPQARQFTKNSAKLANLQKNSAKLKAATIRKFTNF